MLGLGRWRRVAVVRGGGGDGGDGAWTALCSFTTALPSPLYTHTWDHKPRSSRLRGSVKLPHRGVRGAK